MTEASSLGKKRADSPLIAADTSKDAFQRMLASGLFILIILFIGLPMWWKTTAVSRVPLPYGGIKALSDTPLIVRSTVVVYAAEAERGAALVERLRKQFAADNETVIDAQLLQFEFVPVTLQAADVAGVQTWMELERKVLRVRPIGAGEFLFMEWKRLGEEERDVDVLVTQQRTALISTKATAAKLDQVLRTWIFEELKLRSIVADRSAIVHSVKPADDPQAAITPQPRTVAPKRTQNRNLIPYPDYDVVISVLNPAPAQQHVFWDVRSASALYLQPLFDALHAQTRFTIKSQWLYQVALEHPQRAVRATNDTAAHFTLDARHMPAIITALEGKLGQPISDHPALHLVVYVPACSAAPLYIYDANERLVRGASAADVASFLSPDWGALVVANPTAEFCAQAAALPSGERPSRFVDTTAVMQTLLYLTRRLLDVQNDEPVARWAKRQELDSVEPRAFELDAFARSGCVHMVHSATRTLQSLVQLLDEIGNIVINAAVGRAVHEAYESVREAKALLAQNRLAEAVQKARIAFDQAERAFYDPSMLALLYFPDDQKFAVYIPLFMPILLPVLLSVIEMWRFLWAKRKGQAGAAAASRTKED